MIETVIRQIVDEDGEVLGLELNDELAEHVLHALAHNNAFTPGISRVVFNTKTVDVVSEKDADGNPVVGDDGKTVKKTIGLENPILNTVVYFKDGTKVSVKNSEKDAIKLEDRKVKLSDGSVKVVKTASVESLEMGLVYAIVKRLVCGFDEGGNVQGAGFAKFLRKIVDEAYVQDVKNAKSAAEKKISKARNAEKKFSTEKKPKASLRDTVKSLSETVAKLGDVVKQVLSPGKAEGQENPS